MPQVRQFLDRFRPVGAPGSAATSAVPADKAATLAAELDPVLALLADTDRWCAAVIDAAEQEAARLMSDTTARAARIAADGRLRAQAAREAAADEVMAAARAQQTQLRQAAADAARARPAPAPSDVAALIRQAIDFVESGP